MTEIIVAIIAGGMSLVGVIISNNKSELKIQHKLETAQAVTDTKIDELTREVREHNDFGRRIPVIEEQIKVLNTTVEELRGYHKGV